MNSIDPRGSDNLRQESATPWAEDLPFHLLNDTERECLRLVDQGYTSKRIAAERKVRRDTIDKILRVARAKMDNLPRHELARRLVDRESLEEISSPSPEKDLGFTAPPAPSVGVQSVGLADTREMSSSGLPVSPDEGKSGESPSMTVTRLLDLSNIEIARRLLFGSHRSPRNELASWSRTVAISVIAAGTALAAVAIIPLLILLDRIAVGH